MKAPAVEAALWVAGACAYLAGVLVLTLTLRHHPWRWQ